MDVESLKLMAANPIVFALSNPDPEIDPAIAREARPDIIMATGRSDYPNQINNSLCFPGFLRALLGLRITRIADQMKIAAAFGIAESIPESEISKEKIVPDAFNEKIKENIMREVKKAVT